uniref:Uncharacterized protein n=1 Tax=Arundo donax TaxID=35708 RepID=A0A0A8ZIV8_ARUDO
METDLDDPAALGRAATLTGAGSVSAAAGKKPAALRAGAGWWW